jgi:hypothetical protein
VYTKLRGKIKYEVSGRRGSALLRPCEPALLMAIEVQITR